MKQEIEVEHFGTSSLKQIEPISLTSVYGFPKPRRGGLWTSPVNSCHSWKRWCENEEFHLERLNKSFRLKINTSNLLIINSLDDLIEKMVNPKLMWVDESESVHINWEQLVNLYDGIWLTDNGECETRFSHPYNLYGWDCETVFLFNDKPIKNHVDYGKEN